MAVHSSSEALLALHLHAWVQSEEGGDEIASLRLVRSSDSVAYSSLGSSHILDTPSQRCDILKTIQLCPPSAGCTLNLLRLLMCDATCLAPNTQPWGTGQIRAVKVKTAHCPLTISLRIARCIATCHQALQARVQHARLHGQSKWVIHGL